MENQTQVHEVEVINSAEALEAINRAEVDIQIKTAKTYPRELKKVLSQIETLATMDSETAEDCFYALKRGRGDDAKLVEGLSVRFAEIIANSWGNLRIQTMITANDGKMITARGVCHDLESNTAVSIEVKRRITDKYGKTYSEDMQVVTGNAASSIAYRNAVLKVVPKAITKKIVERVKEVAMGKALDLETSRTKAVEYFGKLGVTLPTLLEHLQKDSIASIDKEAILYLRGLITALKEGTATLGSTFPNMNGEKEKEKEEHSEFDRLSDLIKNAKNPKALNGYRKAISEFEGEEQKALLQLFSDKEDELKPKEEEAK